MRTIRYDDYQMDCEQLLPYGMLYMDNVFVVPHMGEPNWLE